MPAINKQITLAARPSGMPKPSDFKLVESPPPEPGPDEFLVRVLHVSVDPYMRGRMNDAKSYAPPVQIGEVMGGGAVGKVVDSKNPQFAAGDFVEGLFGWQEYAISNGKGVRKLDPALAPVSTALGVLGMPGLTAYFGLLEIGKPRSITKPRRIMRPRRTNCARMASKSTSTMSAARLPMRCSGSSTSARVSWSAARSPNTARRGLSPALACSRTSW